MVRKIMGRLKKKKKKKRSPYKIIKHERDLSVTGFLLHRTLISRSVTNTRGGGELYLKKKI